MTSLAVSWMTGTTDEALIDAARSGDRDAYSTLVGRYRNMVFAYALARLGRRDEAEDAAQETFIRAYLALGRLRSAHRWEPWLMRIVRNLCQDAERRRRAHPTVSIEQFWPEGGPGGAEGAEPPLRELLPFGAFGDLDCMVASLPDKYRVPLRMHFALGCTYRETAAALGVPESTIVGRIAGGIRRLRKKLGEEQTD